MMAQRSNLTDRAKRYRAQNAVRGEKRCVLCGTRGRLDVMHLDGNESNGDPRNLAYGCRSCNGKLAAAFKRIGAGVPTNQYNPASGSVPSFQQYAWAVTQHSRGAHDEGGAIIHATPKSKRIEYAWRIAEIKGSRASERWNGGCMSTQRRNVWPFGAEQPLGSRTYHGRAKQSHQRYMGYDVWGSDELGWHTSLGRGDSTFDTAADVKAFIKSWNRKNPKLLSKLHRQYEALVHRIGPERNAKKLQRLIDERDKVAAELARLGFPVNPGKGSFKRCVSEVEAKGGAYDPRAVCAAAGRKKYGAKKFAAMAQAGKRKAARRNVESDHGGHVGSGVHEDRLEAQEEGYGESG